MKLLDKLWGKQITKHYHAEHEDAQECDKVSGDRRTPRPDLVQQVLDEASQYIVAVPITGGYLLSIQINTSSTLVSAMRSERQVKFCKDEEMLAAEIAAYYARIKLGVGVPTPTGSALSIYSSTIDAPEELTLTTKG